MTRAARRVSGGDEPGGARADKPGISSVAAGRAALRDAAAMLSAAARSATFKKTYARMNPAAALSKNVFYFGEPDAPPRAVIWGPYLYVEAPEVRLPAGFERLDQEYRREKHLGALDARLRLADEKSLRAVRELLRRLGE